MQKSLQSIITLSGLAALGGCDAAADLDYRGEPLATIRGQVTTSADKQSEPYLHPRAVLVWQNPQLLNEDGTAPPIGSFERIAEDVAVVSQFPAEFEINLFNPPPAAARYQGIAVASVILYDDKNQNQQLDLVGPGEDPVDWLIGDSEDAVLFAEAGATYNPFDPLYPLWCPTGTTPVIPTGFSIGRLDIKSDEPADGCWVEVHVLDDGTPIVADIRDDISQVMQCLVEDSGQQPDITYPPTTTSELPEFAAGYVRSCEDTTLIVREPGPMGEKLCDPDVYTRSVYPPVTPVPADWPCPFDN